MPVAVPCVGRRTRATVAGRTMDGQAASPRAARTHHEKAARAGMATCR